MICLTAMSCLTRASSFQLSLVPCKSHQEQVSAILAFAFHSWVVCCQRSHWTSGANQNRSMFGCAWLVAHPQSRMAPPGIGQHHSGNCGGCQSLRLMVQRMPSLRRAGWSSEMERMVEDATFFQKLQQGYCDALAPA